MTVDVGSTSAPAAGSMPRIVECDEPRLPAWLSELFDTSPALGDGIAVSHDGERALLSLVAGDANELDDDAFERAVERLYGELLDTLRQRSLHPLRIWNYVPDILRPCSVDHRYMVFNAGRYAAYRSFLGDADSFSSCLPTASGTGSRSGDFVVHCLAARDPGRPLENGRQIPAYRYSQRYGAFPPCFTRATLVTSAQIGLDGPPRPALLVGGTASIRGESSRHLGDLDRQLTETLANLTTLVHHGRGNDGGGTEPSALAGFRDLRVYHPRPADRPRLRQSVEREFPALETVEFVTCDLCRPELLVEIEGTAVL